jgi:single-strand DNA-binding protein
MANFNRVILVGRLTRDPESRSFANGGKVVKFGFAASPFRKKNAETGRWEDEPMFIDCEAYNRGENGTLANRIEQYCRKGSLICIEGKLHLDTWDDKNGGGKRSKHKIVVDTMELLESRAEAESRQSDGAGRSSAPAPQSPARNGRGFSPPTADDTDAPSDSGGGAGAGEEIPF